MARRFNSGAIRSCSSSQLALIAATKGCGRRASAFRPRRLMVGSMPNSDALASTLLAAIAEPALIVERGMVKAANHAARQLLGSQIAGRDLRFAIRHPLALDTILAGR